MVRVNVFPENSFVPDDSGSVALAEVDELDEEEFDDESSSSSPLLQLVAPKTSERANAHKKNNHSACATPHLKTVHNALRAV